MILMDFTSFIAQCNHIIETSSTLAGGLFVAGIVGGFTHCTGMCGPFVMAKSGQMERTRRAALLPYHAGRITTYVLLSMIFFSLVNVMIFFSPLRAIIIAPLLALAGIIFIVSAFPRLSVIFPWATKITLPVPARLMQFLSSKTTNLYTTGLVLGLMPCGMVVAALIAASTANTIYTAALSMAAFGVGTIPALIMVALGGHQLSKKFPATIPAIRSGLMAWCGLWLFVMAGKIIIEG